MTEAITSNIGNFFEYNAKLALNLTVNLLTSSVLEMIFGGLPPPKHSLMSFLEGIVQVATHQALCIGMAHSIFSREEVDAYSISAMLMLAPVFMPTVHRNLRDARNNLFNFARQ